MIELMGNKDDLCCYQRWFCSQTAKVIEENGKYYFTGRHLMGCTAADEAMHRAETKLELMAAAARLESASDAPTIRIGSAVYVDPSGTYHSYQFIEAGSRSGASVRFFDSCRPSLPQRAVAIAECDTHLDMALRLWGEPSRTWPRLYRICEEISNSFALNSARYVSEVLFAENLIDSRVDFLRFSYSANAPDIAGRDCRHADGRNKMPKELKDLENPTMTHQEAVGLVGSVLSRAFRRKWKARSDDTANI